MPHNANHTWGDLAGDTLSWFGTNGGNLVGAAGQLYAANQASNDLSALSAEAKTRIGMPTGSFYDTIKADTKFTPFSVTTGVGQVATQRPRLDAAGNQLRDANGNLLFDGIAGDASYNLNANQTALANSLRTGGTNFLNSSLGQGAYGRPQLNAAGNQLTDATGNPLFENDAGYNLEQYIGTNRSLTDPFDTTNLTTSENALFKQLQTMREPGQLRDQLALDERLFAQGRTGLQTSAYGGSPEQFAMEQAKLEQSGQDQLMAMQLARADAANISDRRQMGIGEARQDRALSGNMAGAFLDASYQPTRELIDAMQPSLNMAEMATVAGRQLGGYGRDLAQSELTYDLGTEQMASDIKREALSSIFGLLMSEQAATGGRSGPSQSFLDEAYKAINPFNQ